MGGLGKDGLIYEEEYIRKREEGGEEGGIYENYIRKRKVWEWEGGHLYMPAIKCANEDQQELS